MGDTYEKNSILYLPAPTFPDRLQRTQCRTDCSTIQPKAESVAAQVDVSGLPEGQCYNQTPYLIQSEFRIRREKCVPGMGKHLSNAPLLGVVDANGNSEALELPDAEYIYSVCEKPAIRLRCWREPTAVLAGRTDEPVRAGIQRWRSCNLLLLTQKPGI